MSDTVLYSTAFIQPCLYRGCGAGFGNVGRCVPQPAAVRGKWIDHFAGKVTALEQCPHCWCVGVPPDRRAQYHSIVIFQVCGNGFQLRRKTAVDFPLSLLDHVVVAAGVGCCDFDFAEVTAGFLLYQLGDLAGVAAVGVKQNQQFHSP